MATRQALVAGLVAFAGACAVSCAVWAQEAGTGAESQVVREGAPQKPGQTSLRSPVLVLDFDELFALSDFGRRILRSIADEGRALVAENDRIEAELSAEELLLTSQRDTLSREEFRALADAFDQKVQSIRSQQDAKARAVGQGREQAELRFRQLVTPLIGRVMQDTGAAVVLNRKQAIVWAEVIDVTGLVLGQVNRAIGDGTVSPSSTDGSGPAGDADKTPSDSVPEQDTGPRSSADEE